MYPVYQILYWAYKEAEWKFTMVVNCSWKCPLPSSLWGLVNPTGDKADARNPVKGERSQGVEGLLCLEALLLSPSPYSIPK